jgi:hypothetical protein
MATLLDQIIDGSSDGGVKTPDLLRKVQVAATRIGAPGVVDWVRQELQGYADDANLPSYRKMPTAVMGHFTGPMQSQIKKQLPPYPGFEEDFFIEMRQPLITLESFAEAEEDAQLQWPAWRVEEYGLYEVSGGRGVHVTSWLWRSGCVAVGCAGCGSRRRRGRRS